MCPQAASFVRRLSFSPPLSHFSSSLPSKQSASASQCHRSGMQWLFLHWNWSLSHFTSQPFCAEQQRTVCVSVSRGRQFAAQAKKEARYLVRSVGAVVVSITLPAASNATAVGAGELALRTLARHWGAHGESQGDGRSGGSKHGGRGGSREEARRGVKEEKRKQATEQTANI